MTSCFLDEVFFDGQIKHLPTLIALEIIVMFGRRLLESFCVWLVGHKGSLLENMLKPCRVILTAQVGQVWLLSLFLDLAKGLQTNGAVVLCFSSPISV